MMGNDTPAAKAQAQAAIVPDWSSEYLLRAPNGEIMEMQQLEHDLIADEIKKRRGAYARKIKNDRLPTQAGFLPYPRI